MSIINKPPQHVKREYELEEPVALVVEKYATFIDSTPDHVVNSALKIVLWRDRHFMNWRKQQQQTALLAAATGMALYFRVPFPEGNTFLLIMALRSPAAFEVLKYSYALFLFSTPYIGYSVVLPMTAQTRCRRCFAT